MNPSPKQHNLEIDVAKGLFAITMILAHVIVLLADKSTRDQTEEIKLILHLVPFSGFLFCFGYATWRAYFSNPTGFKRLLPSVIRPWLAYYLSSILYLLFVEHLFGSGDFLDVLLLKRLVPYAEFLLAFSLTLLAGYFLRAPIGWLLERPRLFWGAVGAWLLTTFLPTGWVQWPWLALFIGSPQPVASAFPLLQYFPVYLVGIYFARYEIQPRLWIGLAGMAAFYGVRWLGGDVTRFPPALAWIAGSFFFVITWYAAARYLARWSPARRVLAALGTNALFSVLMSNMLIFGFRGAAPRLGGALNLKSTLEFALAILAAIYFLLQTIRKVEIEPPPATGPSQSA